MKYLIEIHHGIGDIVQMTGVIDTIKCKDNEAYIALIINKNIYKSLFQDDDRVDCFYRIDLIEMSKIEIVREIIKIRNTRYDYFLLSPISNDKAGRILAKMIGAKKSVGEQLDDNGRKTLRVPFRDIHIVKRNENLLKCLLGLNTVKPPKLCIDTVNLPCNINKKSISLCVGTSMPQKTWKIKNYLEVAERFLKEGYQVLLLGGKKEAEKLKLEEKDLFNGIINLAGELTLLQSAKIASLCKLVVGGDTGVMHMAAAVGASTLTIFSCTNPRLHCPYSDKSYFYNITLPCQFCYEQGNVFECKDYKCIKDISVDTVSILMHEIIEGEADNKYKFVMGDK